MKRFVCGLGVVAVIILAGFGGYGARWVVAKPSNISVNDALTQVALGLKTLYAARPEEGSYGLFPAELEINFSISAGGKLDRLAGELLTTGKPLWTLEDPANAHLVASGVRAVRPSEFSKGPSGAAIEPRTGTVAVGLP